MSSEPRKESRYVTCVQISIYRLRVCAGVQLYILVLFGMNKSTTATNTATVCDKLATVAVNHISMVI